MADIEWTQMLADHLQGLAQDRIQLIQDWATLNTSRFPDDHAEIRALQRAIQNGIIHLNSGIEICRSLCASCGLLCTKGKRHDGGHDCGTTHMCVHNCDFEHEEETALRCNLRFALSDT